jgi:hypothetical protein
MRGERSRLDGLDLVLIEWSRCASTSAHEQLPLNGGDQKRLVAIAGDHLTLSVRPPTGEIIDVIWQRAK